jgi:hypothetical protein
MNRGSARSRFDLKSADGKAVLRDSDRAHRRADGKLPARRAGCWASTATSCRRSIRGSSICRSPASANGPYTESRVYDAVIQAVSGMCASHLEKPYGEPGLVATTICDKLTSLTAAQAVTTALLARERDGHGRVVELSMLDAALAFQWPMRCTTHVADDAPAPRRRRHFAALQDPGWVRRHHDPATG